MVALIDYTCPTCKGSGRVRCYAGVTPSKPQDVRVDGVGGTVFINGKSTTYRLADVLDLLDCAGVEFTAEEFSTDEYDPEPPN